MAEKITIFELDIDVDGSKRDVEELRLAVGELTKGLKELSDAEKENNKKLDEQQKKLKELQSAKKKDIKAIADTQAAIDKTLTKRTELNKSIVDQTNILKTNQSSLRENQKVIQNSIALSDGYNKELEETKIKQQLLTAERKKAIREGIKQAGETRELTILQGKKNRSEAEEIRLNNLLVKQRKNLVVNSKATRKEYNRLTVAIAKNNKQLLKNDKSIGRFQRNVGNYTNSLRGLGGAIGITGGIIGITQLIKSSTKAYEEQAIAVAKLTTVVVERTNATEEDIQSILRLADSQQQLGIIGDEIQIAGAQQIATFVNQTDSIETLLPALNNLLAQQKGVNATQQDAVSIGNLIGKVLQGETTALKRVGITFDATQEKILKYGDESERAAALADVITSNVGNMNEELAKTDVGALKNVSNNLGDISEELGEELLPAIAEVARIVLQSIKGWKLLIGLAREYFGLNNKKNAANYIETFKKEIEFKTEIQKKDAVRIKTKLFENNLLRAQNKLREGSIKFSSKEGKEIRKKIERYIEEIRLLKEIANSNFVIGQKQKELTADAIADIDKLDAANAEAARKRQKRRDDDKKQKEEDAKAEEKLLDDALQKQIDKAEAAKDQIKRGDERKAKNKQDALDDEKEAAIIDQENKLALLETNILGELDAERKGLELKRQQEIEFAESIGADTFLINEKYSKANEELTRAENNAKLSLASDFFANVAQIAGEGTAIGKAAAVAQTIISTYQAATGAYASLAAIPIVGVPLGITAAGAAVAAGFANVKKILAVKSGLPGESGGGGSSIPGGSGGGTTGSPIPVQSSVAPEIGRGIISRGIQGTSQTNNIPQTAVIVDEVTAKQTQQDANSNTSII